MPTGPFCELLPNDRRRRVSRLQMTRFATTDRIRSLDSFDNCSSVGRTAAVNLPRSVASFLC